MGGDLLFADTSQFFYHPYRTPSVNQYWAIVNASLPCNIICSLSHMRFASFKRILTAQKRNLQQLIWRCLENNNLGVVRSRYVTLISHLAKTRLRLAKYWPSLTSLECVMIIALNQY